MSMNSDTEILFSQYAQDPYEDYNQMIKETEHCKEAAEQIPKRRCLSLRRRAAKRKAVSKSFVMSRLQQRGIKLIKISVIDLNNSDNTCDSESENIILNAQYIVKDSMDSVMDETEALVRKISKTLVESDY